MKSKLQGAKKETETVKTFYFEKPDGFEYLPGQYAYIKLPKLLIDDARGNVRHFTLSSSPTEKLLAITTMIRKESGYKMTLDNLKNGTEVDIDGPNGVFVFDDEKKSIPSVYLAGGIGVTPARSIMKYIADSKLDTTFTLIHSSSTSGNIVFKDELDILSMEFPNLKVYETVSEPDEVWKGLKGRINSEMIAKVTGKDLAKNLWWISGPPPMVAAMEEKLEKLNVNPKNILFERFTGY